MTHDPSHRAPDMLHYLLALASWRKFILSAVVVVALVSAGVSLLLPQWYSATASIMPPKEQNPLSMIGGASSLLRNISSISRGSLSLGASQGRYNYMAILKSRRTLETIARRFDLTKIYDIERNSMEETLKELEKNSQFELQEDDYITITVADHDPVRAASIANAYVDVLNTISTELATIEARNNREFIETAVGKTMRRLTVSEDSLKAFQKKSGMLMIPDANSSSVESIAEVYAMKEKKSIEVSILERTVGNDSPLLSQARIELEELSRRVDRIPDIGLGTLRLYRDVMIQQKVLEFLVPMLEQARVEENKNIPATVLLDTAVPPEKRDRPKRTIIVVVSTLSALLLATGYALVVERMRIVKAEHPELYAQLRRFVQFRRQES